MNIYKKKEVTTKSTCDVELEGSPYRSLVSFMRVNGSDVRIYKVEVEKTHKGKRGLEKFITLYEAARSGGDERQRRPRPARFPKSGISWYDD